MTALLTLVRRGYCIASCSIYGAASIVLGKEESTVLANQQEFLETTKWDEFACRLIFDAKNLVSQLTRDSTVTRHSTILLLPFLVNQD